MPTENRSSNTEMVSVPREPSGEMLNAARNAPIPLVHLDSMSARQDLEFSARYKAAIARFPQPDPQPHPEPIAWMVGTAFWWTKEEAERDAAAMGLPIVGLGPMSAIAPAEQHQGQPVGYRWEQLGGNGWCYGEKLPTIIIGSWQELYTNADPGEVERHINRRMEMAEQKTELHRQINDLRAQLAERDALLRERREEDGPAQFLQRDEKDWATRVDAALSASAEPSAPYSATHYYPAAAPDRKWRKQVGGLWCEFCGGKWLPLDEQGMSHEYVAIEPSAPVERDEREQCAICRDLGRQCMECEEAEFRKWADRYFAATDYRKTDAGVFIRDWMRHAYAAWCARAALDRKAS